MADDMSIHIEMDKIQDKLMASTPAKNQKSSTHDNHFPNNFKVRLRDSKLSKSMFDEEESDKLKGSKVYKSRGKKYQILDAIEEDHAFSSNKLESNKSDNVLEVIKLNNNHEEEKSRTL